MKKLARWLLLGTVFTGFLLGLTGVLEWKYCNGISFAALLVFALLDEKNRGEWRFLSVEEARIRLSKKPRILRYLKRDPPSQMPSAAWHVQRNPPWPVYVALIAPVPVVGILIPLTNRILNAAGGASIAVTIALGTLWFAVIFAFFVLLSVPAKRRRTFCKRAESANYELCMDCGYELRGLPEIHECPECGAKYDKVEVQAIWKGWCED